MKLKLNGFLVLLLALVTQITFAQERTVSGTVSADQTIISGSQPATIFLTSSSGSVQWQSSSNNITYTNIVGATNTTLTGAEIELQSAKIKSRTKVDAVKDYLISNGFPADMITSKGFGSVNPIGDNKTRKGRQQNRRVEIFSEYAER